jgi:hypothetical protein
VTPVPPGPHTEGAPSGTETPAKVTKAPSAERESVPEVRSTPEIMTGISSDCTSAPAGVYSSRKVAVAAVFSAADEPPPRPTRSAT